MYMMYTLYLKSALIFYVDYICDVDFAKIQLIIICNFNEFVPFRLSRTGIIFHICVCKNNF